MKSKKVVFIIMGLFIFLSLTSYSRAQEPKRTFILVEAGGLFARNTEGQPWEPLEIRTHHNGKYGVVRVGVVYRLIPGKFDWFLAVGPAILTSGAPSKTFFTFTSGFTMHFVPPWWLGVGANYATKETEGDWDETDFHLVVNTGIDVYRTESKIGSIFFEWQHPARYLHARGKGGSQWFKAILGIRFLF